VFARIKLHIRGGRCRTLPVAFSDGQRQTAVRSLLEA
jgi:hypothetical protein